MAAAAPSALAPGREKKNEQNQKNFSSSALVISDKRGSGSLFRLIFFVSHLIICCY
jgi:hypothetical protein